MHVCAVKLVMMVEGHATWVGHLNRTPENTQGKHSIRVRQFAHFWSKATVDASAKDDINGDVTGMISGYRSPWVAGSHIP